MAIGTDEHPIVISILYYALFLSLGSCLRNIIRKYISARHQTFWLNLVTTFSVLACGLENVHVKKEYGYGGYIAVIYMLITWHSLTLFDSSANPIYSIVAFAHGSYDLARVLWLTTAQLLGAWLSYRAAFAFWSLGLCPYHRKRFAAVGCTTNLNVSAPLGFLIESAGVAFDIFLSLIVFSGAAQNELSVKCLIVTLLTASAVHLTGYNINPVKASMMKFGCTGTSIPIHLLVYWVGPCVSAYLTATAVPHLKKLLVQLRMKLDNKVKIQKTTKSNLKDKSKKGKGDDASDDTSASEEDY